ncbi:MAG: Sir2 family NAD-dependent protein deacetylase [Cyanobacteria bacterium P01_B01_bin.77]
MNLYFANSIACRNARYLTDRFMRTYHAHKFLAVIEHYQPHTWVLTQNIGGFYRSASSQNLVEIHGRASELYCTTCDYVTTLAFSSELEAIIATTALD